MIGKSFYCDIYLIKQKHIIQKQIIPVCDKSIGPFIVRIVNLLIGSVEIDGDRIHLGNVHVVGNEKVLRIHSQVGITMETEIK